MCINRKQLFEDSDKGKALAEWLNRNTPTNDSVARLIRFSVAAEHDASKRGFTPGEGIATAFRLGMVGHMLPEEKKKGAAASPEEYEERLSKGAWVPLDLRAELRPRRGGIDFRLVPQDEDSRWLYLWGELLNSENASRLRICPSCRKYWYCEGRKDKGPACSVTCKVSLWQKTPAGRKAKREYMRDWRANPRVRARNATPNGYQRKRGRKLHVDLKKGD
jgi:hypothetical protein